jgi:hypothetical protein
LAKPNYQFEKRQKELAKKNKKEEKRRQKVVGNTATDDSTQVSAELNVAIPSSPSGMDQVLLNSEAKSEEHSAS